MRLELVSTLEQQPILARRARKLKQINSSIHLYSFWRLLYERLLPLRSP